MLINLLSDYTIKTWVTSFFCSMVKLRDNLQNGVRFQGGLILMVLELS